MLPSVSGKGTSVKFLEHASAEPSCLRIERCVNAVQAVMPSPSDPLSGLEHPSHSAYSPRPQCQKSFGLSQPVDENTHQAYHWC